MGFLFLSRSVAYAGIQCHALASRGMRPSRTTVDGCASYRDCFISMGLSAGLEVCKVSRVEFIYQDLKNYNDLHYQEFKL